MGNWTHFTPSGLEWSHVLGYMEIIHAIPLEDTLKEIPVTGDLGFAYIDNV
jgi:hypothetical protein